MPCITLLLFLFAALITACISGIFGMAGGLIFMGVIATTLGVAQAMIVHGAVQSVSNSYRAYLLRGDIRWDIYWRLGLGAIPALALLALLHFIPTKGVLFLSLGLLPILLWLPRQWIALDAQKPLHAMLCGFCVTGLNLLAGVAGPALDLFFVRTNLQRQEIVATKAVIMFSSHVMKIFYFGIPLVRLTHVRFTHDAANFNTGGTGLGLPPLWFFIAVIPCVMIGTFTGTKILKRMSDIGFRRYTRWIVSVVGVIYVWRGLSYLGVFG